MFNKDLGHNIYISIVSILSLILIIFVISYLVKLHNQTFIAGQTTYGLPTYNGPCIGLINKINETYIEGQKFSNTAFPNKLVQKQAWDDLRNHHLIDAFTLGQFCEDSEADGRLLYLASSIEFVGLSNHLISLPEAIGITQNYYNEAEQLEYNKNHPKEAAWLKNRIERNVYRMKVRKLKSQ